MNVDGFAISLGSCDDIEQSTFHFHDLKYLHTENTNFGEMWCENKEGGSDYLITLKRARRAGGKQQNVLSPHQVGA